MDVSRGMVLVLAGEFLMGSDPHRDRTGGPSVTHQPGSFSMPSRSIGTKQCGISALRARDRSQSKAVRASINTIADHGNGEF